jgi:putative hydrolases of HD superfamily
MSSELKYRIREHHGDMIGLLEKKMIQAILEEIPHERIRSNFTQSYLPTPYDDLIACAKSWASYYEVYNNSLVFPDAYAKLLKNIEKRAIESPFWRMNHILDFDPHNQTQIEKFLLMIHRLASSYRWNQSRRSIPVSVLSHTYIITFFSYLIGIHEDLSDEDITDMLLTALYHDMPEAITGDIITPTKKAIP